MKMPYVDSDMPRATIDGEAGPLSISRESVKDSTQVRSCRQYREHSRSCWVGDERHPEKGNVDTQEHIGRDEDEPRRPSEVPRYETQHGHDKRSFAEGRCEDQDSHGHVEEGGEEVDVLNGYVGDMPSEAFADSYT